MEIYDGNFRCYGARKIWLKLRQDGHDVARCTVERLMRELGLRGAVRGKTRRTTIVDPSAARAKDLVSRRFRLLAPNRLWVADFERHEAFLNRVGVRDLRRLVVAAVG